MHHSPAHSDTPTHFYGAVFSHCQQGPVPYSAFLFGAFFKGDEMDWSFKQFTRPDDGFRNEAIAKHLRSIMEKIGVRELLVPSPINFNGRICSQEELTNPIELGGGFRLLRGAEADGMSLQSGQAIAWSVGGCAIGMFSRGNTLVGMHLGRDCLIDKKLIGTGTRDHSRPNESGVMTAINLLGKQRAAEISVQILFPISAEALTHPVDHPEYGTYNQKMLDHIRKHWGDEPLPGDPNIGAIDIAKLAAAQCLAAGISSENIFSDFPIDPSPLTHHTRHYIEDWRNRRNLVIVKRH